MTTVYRSSEQKFHEAYGILCASLPSNSSRAGLYPTFCKIPTGGNTASHSHFEGELFYIICGQGLMEIAGETSRLESGDLVVIPPFSVHELRNTGAEELCFLSVYSDDVEIPAIAPETVVTAAPPTPNGSLHLGHMSGPYLAADIAARYLRARGAAVLSHSGTDDHQNYVGERARALGFSPEAFRKKMRARIESSLRAMQIAFDEFVEPKTDSAYKARVERFARAAVAKGAVVQESLLLPHCAHCDRALVDALIDGTCPVCNAESRGGCESCGVVVMPQALLDPKCARCGHAAEPRATSVYVFDLKRHLPAVDLSGLSLTKRLRELVDRVAGMTELKVLVSYPGTEGMQFPNSEQTMHVWFEMAAHYEKFATGQASWIHAFGFDNSFYYLLFIPALLKAVNPLAKLPDAVLTNEFLLLDGLKFSTSRGHAVWADEFDGNTDHLRFYLSLHRPGARQSDFSVKDFRTFSAKLESQMRTLHNLARTAGSARPEDGVLAECNRFTRELEDFLSPEKFDPRRAAHRIMEWIDLAAQDGDRLRIRALAANAAPIMPGISKSLQAALGETSPGWVTDWARTL